MTTHARTLLRLIPRRTARRTAAASLVAALAIAALVSCKRETESAPRVASEHTCEEALGLGTFNLYGDSLPPKTLALTFDDGPGARTTELSAYLHSRGIPAAFFVNGKMLTQGTAVLAQLTADGHLVANHTQTHTSLTGRATGHLPLSAAAVVSEVEQTDTLIAPFIGDRLLFRAPYGDYDLQTAADLNASAMSKYVGPVGWDIGNSMGPAQAADWDCWIPGADALVLTPGQCGDRYVAEIERVGRGIVLFHDPYFIGDDPALGGTVDMIPLIVPILEAKGYSFVRVDHVPAIAALLPPDASGSGSHDGGAKSPDAGAPTDAATSPNVTFGSGDGAGVEAGLPSSDPCARARSSTLRMP